MPRILGVPHDDQAPQRKTEGRSFIAFSWSPNPAWAAAFGTAFAFGLLAMNRVSEFLYFQF